jgi:elongation factor 1-gamma
LKAAQDAIDKAFAVLNTHLLSHTYLVGERVTVADIALASLLHRLYLKHFKPEYQQENKHVTRWFKTISSQPQFVEIFGGETKKKKQEEVVKFKFDMETWKRVYMNAKDKRKEALEWFWSNLDPQNNSIYFAEYKYPKDLMGFLATSNLTRGFCQRLEIVRRFGFGVIITVGEDKDHTIKCVFVFNGSEYPKMLTEVADFDSYEWTKADWEKDKARIEDYLVVDKDTIDGIRVEDWRIFR